MADQTQQPDADGYYGEEEIDNEDIDLSFLDEDEKNSK
jgi:hypothetical protein